MNIKTCKSCESFYIGKSTWKYCPLCGSKLVTRILINELKNE